MFCQENIFFTAILGKTLYLTTDLFLVFSFFTAIDTNWGLN